MVINDRNSYLTTGRRSGRNLSTDLTMTGKRGYLLGMYDVPLTDCRRGRYNARYTLGASRNTSTWYQHTPKEDEDVQALDVADQDPF